MEIIKQIKAAESEAKQIIEQAKIDAQKISEEFAKTREDKKSAAADQRRKAIEAAVAESEAKAKDEVEKLMGEGASQREQMQNAARGKSDAAAAKVVNKLREL